MVENLARVNGEVSEQDVDLPNCTFLAMGKLNCPPRKKNKMEPYNTMKWKVE